MWKQSIIGDYGEIKASSAAAIKFIIYSIHVSRCSELKNNNHRLYSGLAVLHWYQVYMYTLQSLFFSRVKSCMSLLYHERNTTRLQQLGRYLTYRRQNKQLKMTACTHMARLRRGTHKHTHTHRKVKYIRRQTVLRCPPIHICSPELLLMLAAQVWTIQITDFPPVFFFSLSQVVG